MNRKKTKIILIAASILVIGFCLVAATFFGEKTDLYVAGEVRFSPDMQARAAGKSTLFIILFDQESESSMPYAAYKTHVSDIKPQERVTFKLTKNNVQLMPAAMANKSLPAFFRVKARLDADGIAGPDSPGDLVGESKDIPYGAKDKTILIDHAITE